MPVAALRWISSMMPGRKVPLVSSTLKSLLPDIPIALVEVPKFAAGDNLFKVRGGGFGFQAFGWEMPLQSGFQKFDIVRAQVFDHGVGSEARNLPAHVALGGVHGIGEGIPGVATDNERSLLPHESCHVSAVSTDEHQSALHGHARASRRIAVHDHRSAANGRARAISSAPMHDSRSMQHGFSEAPASAAGHFDGRAVPESAAVVAGTALNRHMRRFEN